MSSYTCYLNNTLLYWPFVQPHSQTFSPLPVLICLSCIYFSTMKQKLWIQEVVWY